MTAKSRKRSAESAQIGMDNLFAGSSTEDLAKAHFKSWNWTAAKPEPDVGGDLVLEVPAQRNERGAVFAAQVRSGKNWKAKERIKRASALRLMGSPLPAFMLFINRTTREIRWAYLEPLFNTEATFCNGGDLLVPLPKSSVFAALCAAPPPEFIEAVYRSKERGAMKAAGSLSVLARAVHDYYQSIDPELVVQPTFDGKRDVLTITARSAPVSMTVEVRGPTERSKTAFRDAVEWGRPAIVEAHEVVLGGSPLWSYLARQKHVTQLEIRPEPVWQGRGTFTTQGDSGRRDTEVVDVVLNRGTLGGECAVTSCRGLLKLRIRIDAHLSSKADVTIEYAVMNDWPITSLSAAERALKILDGALAGDMVELQLIDFHQADIGPIRFRWEAGFADGLDELVFPLRAAVALLRVARSQGWQIQGCPLAKAKRSDMDTWLSGQQLLEEGRTELPAFGFAADFRERPILGDSDAVFGDLLLENYLDVTIGGEVLGRLPAWVRFRNYYVALEPAAVGTAWRIRCTPGDGATREYLTPSDDPPTCSY